MNNKTPLKKQTTLRQRTNNKSLQLLPASSSTVSPVKTNDEKPQLLKTSNLQISKTNSYSSNCQESQSKTTSNITAKNNKDPSNKIIKKDSILRSQTIKNSYKMMSINIAKSKYLAKVQKQLVENKTIKSAMSTSNLEKMKLDDLKQSQDMSKNLITSSELLKSDRKETITDFNNTKNLGRSYKLSDKKLLSAIDGNKSTDDKNKENIKNITLNSPSNPDSSYIFNGTNDGKISKNGFENINSDSTSSINISKLNSNSPLKDIFINSHSEKNFLINLQNEQKDQPTQDNYINNNNGNSENTNLSMTFPQRINTFPQEYIKNLTPQMSIYSVDPYRGNDKSCFKDCTKINEEEKERIDFNSKANELRNNVEMLNKSEFNFKSSSLREGANIQQLFLNKTQSNNFMIFETISKIENEFTVKSSISNPEDHGGLIPNLNLNEHIINLKKYCKVISFKLPDRNKRICSEKVLTNLQNLKERINKGLIYPSAVTFASNRQEQNNEKEFLVFPVNERAFSPSVSQDGVEKLKQILSGKKVTMNYSPISKKKCDRSFEEEELLDTMHISNLIVKNEKLNKIKEKETLEPEIFSERNDTKKCSNSKLKLSDKFTQPLLIDIYKDNSNANREQDNKKKLQFSDKEEFKLLSPQINNNRYNPFHYTKHLERVRESFSTAKLEDTKYDKFYLQSFKKIYNDIDKKRFNYNLLYNQISKPHEVLSNLKTNISKMKNQYNNLDNRKNVLKSMMEKDNYTFKKPISDNKLVEKIRNNTGGFSYLSKFFK